jgi:hypothetical protein
LKLDFNPNPGPLRIQAAHVPTAVLTRHPNLPALLHGLIRIMRDSPDPHALINAHRSIALVLRNDDLASCLGRCVSRARTPREDSSFGERVDGGVAYSDAKSCES